MLSYFLLIVACLTRSVVLGDDSSTVRLVTSFISDPAELDSINYISYDPAAGDSCGVYTDSTAYDFQGYITEEGYFLLSEGGYVGENTTYLYVDGDNGAISVSNTTKSGPFEIKDDVLYYQGSASFYLLEMVAASSYDLYWGTNTDSLSTSYTLLLDVTDASGSSIDDYSPDDAATSYELTTTTSTTSSTSSTSSGGAVGVVGNTAGALMFVLSVLSMLV